MEGGVKSVADPKGQPGNRPDRGRADQFSPIKKQTNRQHQTSGVAHPKQVSHTADAPVVNGLRQKENHGQETHEAKAQRQWPMHLLKNITHAPVTSHSSTTAA